MPVRRFNVKACRESNGKKTWVQVALCIVNDDGTGAFYPNWLPDVTYRLFEETTQEAAEREGRRRDR